MKATLALFFKSHVGAYLRGGKMVNINGYQGRAAHAVSGPGQRDLFGPDAPAARPHATETPEFKDWFGYSKVVDDQGKPMVVYHATVGDFSEFKVGGSDPTVSGHAIWFTDSKGHQPANHNVGAKRDGSARDGHNVMPVYLSMKRPLIIDDKVSAEWARSAFAGGSMEFPQLLPKRWVEAVRAGGEYDGIIYDAKALAKDYGWSDPPENEYIVFDPTQIKSATGNNGKFDRSNTDITKSLPVVFFGQV